MAAEPAHDPQASSPTAVAKQRAHPVKLAAPAVRRHPAERPGYVLNDAQIAAIKARLNLTPDQQQMWPAVEAALRNMAYAHTPEGEAAGRARELRIATVDPDAVRDLKYAAVPLIMSFSSEQKDEVRNIARGMGLDQLASQF